MGIPRWRSVHMGGTARCIDTTELLLEAEKFKVADVAGEGFYTDPGKGKNCMRLSFGNVSPEKIEIGMERLGSLIRSRM